MAKAGELSWDEDLEKSEKYDHTPTALWAADMHGGGKEGIDPLNKSEKRIKDGEVPRKPSDEEISNAIMHNAPKQPTDEEMFGHLVVPEEDLAKKAAEWEGTLQGFYDAATAPVLKKTDDEEEWGSGKSFNETLSEEERIQRNMYTGDK